jgi:DnaK suppressor protein
MQCFKSNLSNRISGVKNMGTKNSSKWNEIKDILQQMKDETLQEINKTVKSGTETLAINEPSGDIYDQASSERDRELGLLLGDREREKLHNIDEALLRIHENEYGICEECDEEIPLGRLKVLPFARHCVKCKTDLEKLHAQTRRFEEDRTYREIPIGSEEDDI